MSGKVVNLNQARKQKVRVKSASQAHENAVKFGLSKAQKLLNKSHSDKAKSDLDGHERDDT